MIGFLLINKPKGISSAFCVGRIKKIIGRKSKIGHAGTLDPFATGLLIIAIGREATKQLPHLMSLKKIYHAVAKIGELTDTLDHTGTVIENSYPVVTEQKIREALQSFDNTYYQIPPLYSACKHQGEPLYKLARQQIISINELTDIAQKKQKLVHLYDLQLISFDYPFFTVTSTVSQGTYIRVLMNDIAKKAGTCATTYELNRTAIGPFTIIDAISLEKLMTIEDVGKNLIQNLFY